MMRLGLLDAVPSEYTGIVGKTDPEYFRELFAMAGVRGEMPDYLVSGGIFPQDINECDAYLITGSPRSVYEDLPWIARLQDFVRECHCAGKPLVGICFGHQVIARALGGTVGNAPQGWLLGPLDFRVQREKPWMLPYRQDCCLYFFNHDQVIDLPPGAERIASSDDCPNVMYTLGDRILCLQPHPEHVRSSIAAFLGAIRDELSDVQLQQAHASLQRGEPDAKLFGEWIWQFLHTTTQ